jgi:hypothetical protein
VRLMIVLPGYVVVVDRAIVLLLFTASSWFKVYCTTLDCCTNDYFQFK